MSADMLSNDPAAHPRASAAETPEAALLHTPSATEAAPGPEESAFPQATGSEPPAAEAQKDDTPDYVALKYTFFTPKRGDLCGAFCLIYDGHSTKTINQTLWLTRADTKITFKPSEPWRSFMRLLSQLGPYDAIWGEKLNAILPDLFPEADRTALFEEGRLDVKRALLRVENDIRHGFERATHNFFNVASDVELLTRKDLEEAGLLDPTGSPSDESDDARNDGERAEKPFEEMIVQCLPVIDPVWGKAASELAPNDVVEVSLKNNAGTAGLVQKFLASTNQSPTFPVEEIDRREDKTYIYLRISPDILGLLTLTKDLRLKTKRAVVEKERKKVALDDLFFFAMLGVSVVGLLLAVRYFFM